MKELFHCSSDYQFMLMDKSTNPYVWKTNMTMIIYNESLEAMRSSFIIYFLQKHPQHTKTILMRHLYCSISSMEILIIWSSALLYVQKPTVQAICFILLTVCI